MESLACGSSSTRRRCEQGIPSCPSRSNSAEPSSACPPNSRPSDRLRVVRQARPPLVQGYHIAAFCIPRRLIAGTPERVGPVFLPSGISAAIPKVRLGSASRCPAALMLASSASCPSLRRRPCVRPFPERPVAGPAARYRVICRWTSMNVFERSRSVLVCLGLCRARAEVRFDLVPHPVTNVQPLHRGSLHRSPERIRLLQALGCASPEQRLSAIARSAPSQQRDMSTAAMN